MTRREVMVSVIDPVRVFHVDGALVLYRTQGVQDGADIPTAPSPTGVGAEFKIRLGGRRGLQTYAHGLVTGFRRNSIAKLEDFRIVFANRESPLLLPGYLSQTRSCLVD
jgi:hypothetical protein